MPENSQELHESADVLSADTTDRHRAIASLMEELEAVDWYQQRVEATTDSALAAILAHNRDEEKEHAAMVLEWLRRHDQVIDKQLRTYLFTTEPVTEVEGEAEGGDATATSADGSLGIGGLRARPAPEATSRARPAPEATSRARPAPEATSRARPAPEATSRGSAS